MAITYGFYNSINGDRKYNATQMSQLFDGLIEDGVYLSIGDAFAVTQSVTPGMTVRVGTGRAWVKHTWTYNDSILTLNVDTADIVYPRIDTVVLEINRSDSIRANSIKIIKGTPAAVPAAPTLLHNDTVDQMPLADLYVGANVTQIINANITIRVGTEDFPFVAGVLSSFDVNTLLAQWDSYYDNTFLPGLTQYFNTTFLPQLEAEYDAQVLVWDGEFNAFIAACQSDFEDWLATQTVKEVLTANRTYYVRGDGSDSNSGLTNDSTGAWLTIQYAVDHITRNFDLRQYNITIYVVDLPSTVYDPFILHPYATSGGYITISGLSGNEPTIFRGSYSYDLITAIDAGYWVLKDLKLSYSRRHVYAVGNTKIDLDGITHHEASTSDSHIYAGKGAVIDIINEDNIFYGAGSHVIVDTGAQVNYLTGSTINFTGSSGTINFVYGFVYVKLNSLLNIPSTVISTNLLFVTGKRYRVIGNSTIFTNGKPTTYFPGSIVGEETYGGIYF